MNLIKYEGKHVRLHSVSGKIYKGKVTDYIFPEDNYPEGVESIVLDTTDGRTIEFPKEDIKSITVLK